MLGGCGEGTHTRMLALLYKLQTQELITEVSRFLLVVHCFHFVLWNMRDTWSNRQVWPGSTKLSRAKANRVLPRERTGHSKHPLPTTRDDTTHGHHQMDNTKISLVSLCRRRWRSSIQSAKTRLRADCGSGHDSLLTNSDLILTEENRKNC